MHRFRLVTEQARLVTIISGGDDEPACEAVIPAAQKASYSLSLFFLCIWGPSSHWRLLDCATSEHKKYWSVGGLFWPCTDSNPPLLQLLPLLRLCMLSVLVLACVCVCFCVFETELFYLASNGCNRWEMELAGKLYMLWMHVDGSP